MYALSKKYPGAKATRFEFQREVRLFGCNKATYRRAGVAGRFFRDRVQEHAIFLRESIARLLESELSKDLRTAADRGDSSQRSRWTPSCKDRKARSVSRAG